MTDSSVFEEHQIPVETPVYFLDCEKAWKGLSDNVRFPNPNSGSLHIHFMEKLYAHYISQASWAGTKVCMRQLSVESVPLFDMFQALFKSTGGPAKLKDAATAAGVAESDWNGFMQYVLNFYGNMGNYKSFGDTKFVPRIGQDSFAKIVHSANNEAVNKLWASWGAKIFSLGPAERELGFPDSGKGLSCYYSDNVTRAEIDLVSKVMNEHNIGFYNTRLFKLEDGTLEVRQASVEKGTVAEYKSGDHTVRIVRGDHSEEMSEIVRNLEKAIEYAANDNQRQMLRAYVKHFQHGSENDHKDAQRWWIKDKGPIVESNIGFIESYRDPLGVRGEWEGFVAVVNKEMTAKFSELVSRAESFIAQLPWPREFEKEKFLKPDFTSLEVISFASSGIPAGINIPNYDDIRQTEGFKNVSLGNVLSASKLTENVTFLQDSDQDVYRRLLSPAFEVQVGIHELLGHGSGKLLVENADGTFNFDKNLLDPLSGKPVSSWYKQQTYDSVFGSLSSPMEECRAESVGIFLCVNQELLKIFGHEGSEASDIVYVNWLNMCRAGLLALEFYSPEKQGWRQAHMQARFSILSVLLAAGNDFVKLHEIKDASGEVSDIHVILDRSKIESIGIPAMTTFLKQMMVYKATAQAEAANALFDGISAVLKEARWLNYRSIVLNKKKPRRLFVQPVTQTKNGGSVDLVVYDPSPEGMVSSYLERF